jgi:hypothetical protein
LAKVSITQPTQTNPCALSHILQMCKRAAVET